MLSWKEKVADKLSGLLGDAPSSPPAAAVDPLVSHHKAKSYSTEESSSPKKSTLSFLLSYLPTASSGVNGYESNNPIYANGSKPTKIRSLPRSWKTNGFAWKDKPLDIAECETGSESDEAVEPIEKIDVVAESNINGQNPSGVEKAYSVEFLPSLMEKSTFLSANLHMFLHSSLPNIVKGCQWVLLYSTLKHGISFQTLLRRSGGLPGPCLLIVGDMKGAVFGGLLDSPLKPTAKRKYQGTHKTFVFTTIQGEPTLFRPTGANRYYYLCLNDMLAFGGGGNFALCLDEDLLHGTSGPCDTFGNLCLAHTPEFELKNVELWGFSHSSRCPT